LIPAAAVGVLALLALAATPKGMAPLSARYLSGRTFHSPDGWFQIDVPAGWEWFEMRAFDGAADPRWPDAVNQTVAWMVRDPKTFDDLVVIERYTPGGDVILKPYARSFEEQTRKVVEPDTATEFTTELVTLAGERSLHYRYKLVRKNGAPALYRFGYVSGMEHKVTLSTSDKLSVEPPWFTAAVHSLRWLKVA
jgi:hypothetical protein